MTVLVQNGHLEASTFGIKQTLKHFQKGGFK